MAENAMISWCTNVDFYLATIYEDRKASSQKESNTIAMLIEDFDKTIEARSSVKGEQLVEVLLATSIRERLERCLNSPCDIPTTISGLYKIDVLRKIAKSTIDIKQALCDVEADPVMVNTSKGKEREHFDDTSSPWASQAQQRPSSLPTACTRSLSSHLQRPEASYDGNKKSTITADRELLRDRSSRVFEHQPSIKEIEGVTGLGLGISSCREVLTKVEEVKNNTFQGFCRRVEPEMPWRQDMKNRTEWLVKEAKALKSENANESTWRDSIERFVLLRLQVEIDWQVIKTPSEIALISMKPSVQKKALVLRDTNRRDRR